MLWIVTFVWLVLIFASKFACKRFKEYRYRKANKNAVNVNLKHCIKRRKGKEVIYYVKAKKRRERKNGAVKLV